MRERGKPDGKRAKKSCKLDCEGKTDQIEIGRCKRSKKRSKPDGNGKKDRMETARCRRRKKREQTRQRDDEMEKRQSAQRRALEHSEIIRWR